MNNFREFQFSQSNSSTNNNIVGIGVYNPYSLKKLTPTKQRDNHSMNQRQRISIETNNFNSHNFSNLSTNGNKIQTKFSICASSTKNPYNLGLYKNKSFSRQKENNQASPSVQNSLTFQQQQQQHQQNDYNISTDQAKEKGSQISLEEFLQTQLINQQTNITNTSSNKFSQKQIKTPKLTLACFSEIKSPCAPNKVFLSPQTKCIIGLNKAVDNKILVTCRKQSNGSKNIEIFQNQSLIHTHHNSFHLVDKVQNNSLQENIENKCFSNSSQQLSSQAYQINLINQQSNLTSQVKNNNTNNQNIEYFQTIQNEGQNNVLSPEQENNAQKNNQNEIQTLNSENITQEFSEIKKDQYQIQNQSTNYQAEANFDVLTFETTNSENLSSSIIDLIKTTFIPNHEKTKHSLKKNGIVKCYAANTNQGLIRNYNEDRVSIILNVTKLQGKSESEQWPKCSFFGVYDGHGGVSCADFLRDNLHQFVIKDSNFPINPKQALINGFEAVEKQFLKQALQKEGQIEKSGSCAIVLMIVGTNCYVANVGDSRAIMSCFGGLKASQLSRDHKPLDEIEQKRIIEAGGKIYQQFN